MTRDEALEIAYKMAYICIKNYTRNKYYCLSEWCYNHDIFMAEDEREDYTITFYIEDDYFTMYI